ncbi:MAG: caspase family protein [Cyanobacteria bacterium J06607_13]
MSDLEFSQSLAIVIGINRYGRGIAPLRTAVADAQAIAQTLQKDHGYDVLLLTDEQAKLAEVRSLIQTKLPSHLLPDSRLLLYFAGHGIAQDGDDGPAGFLIPQDAAPGDIASYLPMVELHDALTALPCRHFLAIFDCCFAGAFRWSSTRDIDFAPEVIHQERFDRFRQDPAWQVITSAAYDQKAMDVLSLRDDRGELQGKHSPFAAALLNALRGDADAFPPANDGQPAGDGVITATELYLYLRDSVEILTEGQRKRQTPELCPLRKHDKGEFIFLTPGHALNLPPAPPLNVENNPYRGLQSFDEHHHHLFFGREQEVEQLLKRLASPHPLTVVLGASGTGKSSLVRAGLLPRLAQKTAFHVLPVMRPGNYPLESLARSCLKLLPTANVQSLIQQLSEDENAFAEIVGKWHQAHPDNKLLFVIDQTEELITQAISPEESHQFQRLVKRAMAERWACLWIIATLRLDFEAQFQDEALQTEWMDARFVISPMSQAQLRDAIEKPAAARVLYFDPPRLIDQLVDDVSQTPGALPLLSFTLSELYLRYLARRSDNRALTAADYRALGGVAGSLTQRATQEYQALVSKDEAYAQTVKHVMLRMVALEGGELARRRVPLSELVYAEPAESARVQTVLDRLIAARLIVRGQDGAATSADNPSELSSGDVPGVLTSEPYVEPAHDALVRGWDKLLRWKRAEQEGLALQRLLSPVAKEWHRQANKQEAKGLLWDDNPRLGLLQETLASEQNWLNKCESEFVVSSLNFKRGKRLRLFGTLTVVFAALTGLSLGLGALAYRLEDAASKAFADELTATAETLADRSSTKRITGALLAVHAHQLLTDLGAASPEVNQVLRSSLTIPESRSFVHQAPVTDVSYHPNGLQMATASADGLVRLWNVETQQVLYELRHEEEVTAVSYSPNGTKVATASTAGVARIWDATTGKEEIAFAHEDSVNGVSFSPDGQRLATASDDQTAAVWAVATGRKLGEFAHEDGVIDVSFSADGARIATASYDQAAIVWSVSTGQEMAVFEHEDIVTSVSFDPGGNRLATGSADAIAQIWDVATEEVRFTLQHDDWINDVSFSPDGRHLVTASDDYMARVWDATQGQLVLQLQHDDWVNAVAFSPDAQQLLTASEAFIASVWSFETPLDKPPPGHRAEVTTASFSPDGQRVVSASRDSTARLWESATRRELFILSHGGPVTSAHFSPDGQQVLTASRDSIARLWESATGQAQFTLSHAGAVTAARFSPDGQQVATASQDKTVKLWNGRTGQERLTLNHSGAVTGVNFSPDGELLLSIEPQQVRIWEVGTGRERFPIEPDYSISAAQFSPDPQQPLIAIAGANSNITLWNFVTQDRFELPHATARVFGFSEDGQLIATAGRQGEVKVWNIASLDSRLQSFEALDSAEDDDGQTYALTEPVVTFTHEGAVNAVSFSADGRYLATASVDRTAQVWDLEADDQAIAGVKHDGNVTGVSLSPLGDRLATASQDATVSIASVSSDLLAQQVCQRLSRNLTPLDWTRYVERSLTDYEQTCTNLPVHPLVDDFE